MISECSGCNYLFIFHLVIKIIPQMSVMLLCNNGEIVILVRNNCLFCVCQKAAPEAHPAAWCYGSITGQVFDVLFLFIFYFVDLFVFFPRLLDCHRLPLWRPRH